MELRPYQRASVDAIYDYFETNKVGNGLVVAPTASGKSVLIAKFCEESLKLWPQTKILMLAHRKELLEQNASKVFAMWKDAPVGIYSAGLRSRQLGRSITIAGIQSIAKKAKVVGWIDIIIIDECFTGETTVSTPNGEKRIDLVRCGDIIHNALGLGVVEAVSSRPASELLKIEFSDGTKIRCTPNHPIFTSEGWIKAGKLERGQICFSKKDLRSLWERVSALVQAKAERRKNGGGREAMEQEGHLLNLLLKEATQSNEQSSDSTKSKRKAKRDKAQAYKTWRERAIATLATNSVTTCLGGGLGVGSSHSNEGGAPEPALSKPLQDRHSQQGEEGGDRTGRGLSLCDSEKGARREEDCFVGFPRVVNISSVECESPIPVFNLCVSGHPSYFANGKLVHNCHLLPADGEGSYRTLIKGLKEINPRLRVIGFTATPYRMKSGHLIGANTLFTDIIDEIDVVSLIEAGYLCPLVSKSSVTQADLSNVHTRGGEFVQGEAEKAFDIDELTKAAIDEMDRFCVDRKSIIVFCSGVEHSRKVALAMSERGIPTESISGETPPMVREDTLNRFKTGQLKAVTNCDVLCLDEKTEILTQEGWQTIDSIKECQRIACWENDRIFFAPPKLIVRRERMLGEQMVSLKTSGVDIRVTSNHRMLEYYGRGRRKLRIAPALSLVNKRACLPAHGISDPYPFDVDMSIFPKDKKVKISALKYSYKTRYGITDEEALLRAKEEVLRKSKLRGILPKDLSLEHCKLIGFWIGDGTLSNNRCAISQSFAYPDNIEYVESLLKNTHISFSRQEYKPALKSKHSSVRWSLARGTGSQEQARKCGYYVIEAYLDKDGSDLLWGLNKDQVQSLMEGLWKADGLHHSKYKRFSIALTNKKLLDLLQAIMTCRGIRTSLRRGSLPRNEKHKQQWILSWSKADKIVTGRKKFELESEYIKERVWCVTSNTGTLVVRRNGKVSVVGNTTGFDAPIVDVIVLLRATQSTGLYCLDKETEILTSHGWKGINEANLGDCAAALDLETGKGKWSPILSKVVRDVYLGESWVSYNAPRANFRVTGSHNVIFASKKFDRTYTTWRVETASKVASYRDGIRMPSAIEIPQIGVPLTDSELYFIGMMMTDGTCSSHQASISQSERHPEILVRIEECLTNCNLAWTKKKRKLYTADNYVQRHDRWNYYISAGKPRNGRKGSGFRHLMPYLDKDFSPALMAISKEQFVTLLKAIDDGDGFKVSKSPKCDWIPKGWTICSARKVFIERVQALAAINGFTANLRSDTHGRTNPIFILTVTPQDWRSVGGCGKRPQIETQEAIDLTEKVWCVETKEGTIVTRRKGKVTVMGNCQILGRGMRLFPDKKNCLVLDFGGNLERHGAIDDISVARHKSGKEKDKELKGRLCSQCRTLIARTHKECPECGHIIEVIPREVDHDTEASDKSPMSGGKAPESMLPQKFQVESVNYARHEGKEGKAPSMKVIYDVKTGEGNMNRKRILEWVAVENPRARSMGMRWWLEHLKDEDAGRTFPETVNEVLQKTYNLKKPTAIWVQKKDGWDRIVSRVFPSKEQEVVAEKELSEMDKWRNDIGI